MTATSNDSGVWGYVRLSREEIATERSVPMADKLTLRRQILQTIARHHNLTLPDAQVVIEVKSGGNLEGREGLLGLLAKCRAREIHTLVCFDVDRLTRDVADLKIITSAFYKGQITLITQRGVDRFDRNHDSTLMQILAVLGEKERRSFSYRRKATNTQRTREGRPSNGSAPYGYRWDNAAGVYRVQPGEHAVVEEIFTLAWRMGGQAIAQILNERGVLPPSASKHGSGVKTWSAFVTRDILGNPFYCGYMAHRDETDRDGKTVKLPRAEWVWSDAAGDWPCPLTRQQWEDLQEIVTERRFNRQSCGVSVGMLTGLLKCAEGRPMMRANKFYQCDCKMRGNAHAGRFISRPVIESALLAAAARRLDALPPLPKVKKTAPPKEKTAETRLRTVRAAMREKLATLEDLTRRAGFYINLPTIGAEGHAKMMTTLDAEITNLAAQAAALEADAAQSGPEDLALLAALREGLTGAELLGNATEGEQREILRLLMAWVRLRPPPPADKRQWTREADLQWRGIASAPPIEEICPLTYRMT